MKNAQTHLDPNEQTPARYKLFSTAIRSIGMAQIASLQPYLQSNLESTLYQHLELQPAVDGAVLQSLISNSLLTVTSGWNTVKMAPLMRDLASGMLGVYFFGEKLCW